MNPNAITPSQEAAEVRRQQMPISGFGVLSWVAVTIFLALWGLALFVPYHEPIAPAEVCRGLC